MAYRIRDWNKHFENNRTRELKRMEWIPVPNKMDGAGYRELVDHEDGAAHLGAWYALLEISSRQTVRGTIPQESAAERGDIPQDLAATCRCVARISGLRTQVFVEAIPRLLQIGWLEELQPSENERVTKIPHNPAPSCGEVTIARAEWNGMEWNGKTHTQHGANAPTVRAVADQFSEFIAPWPRVANPDHAARAWLSCVNSPADQELAFAARDRYLASDEVSRGIITDPAKWLMDQKSTKWGGKWPPAASRTPNGKATATERALATMIDRAKRGERPA